MATFNLSATDRLMPGEQFSIKTFDGKPVTTATMGAQNVQLDLDPGEYVALGMTTNKRVRFVVIQPTSGLAGPQGPKGDQGAPGPPPVASVTSVMEGEEPDLEFQQLAPGHYGITARLVRGRPGVQGNAGPVGDQGQQGATGQPGPQGPSGVQGATGPKGDVGPAGVAGSAGVQGATGPQGIPGPVGPQGSKGDVGDRGLQGAKGDAGVAGSQGAVGPQGPAVATFAKRLQTDANGNLSVVFPAGLFAVAPVVTADPEGAASASLTAQVVSSSTSGCVVKVWKPATSVTIAVLGSVNLLNVSGQVFVHVAAFPAT